MSLPVLAHRNSNIFKISQTNGEIHIVTDKCKVLLAKLKGMVGASSEKRTR